MGFKKKIRFIHKWLGLTSGLIVFIVAITGCIFCFHDEIKDITRKEWRLVEVQDKPYVKPSILKEKAEALLPGADIVMVAYTGPNRTAAVYANRAEDWFFITYNPYTGEHLMTENMAEDFFIIIQYLHMYLLLPEYIGKHIVAGATIIFILMMISGIVIWWPKKRKDLKNRLSVKWSAKWRRVNYDWHNVSGFYIAILAVIIAITGLRYSYEWVQEAMYFSANLQNGLQQEQAHAVIDTSAGSALSSSAIDRAMADTFQKHPDAQMFFVHFSEVEKDHPIETGAYPKSLYYDGQHNYDYHPESGKLLKSAMYSDKSAGLKLLEMSYGIHTGQILGLPGKIIAFILSLIAAALPVTGFVIWYGRKNKSKKKKKTKAIAA
jgi:uncharacterized iron-regulated membrane protein